MSRATKTIIAYAIGQATQLVLHGMVISLNMWDNKRVPFCIAGGFVILVAIVAGTVIAKQQDAKLEQEKKSYFDWAKIPEDDANEKS